MIIYTSSVIKLDIILSKWLMRTYITTANYLNLHKIFLCLEKKYGQIGRTVSNTDREDIRAAIKELQLSILNWNGTRWNRDSSNWYGTGRDGIEIPVTGMERNGMEPRFQ